MPLPQGTRSFFTTKAVFQWFYRDSYPHSSRLSYVVYSVQFATLAFAPAVVARNHSHLISQDVDYFQCLRTIKVVKLFVQKVMVSERFRKQNLQ